MGARQLRAATAKWSRAEYERWFKQNVRRVIGYLEWLRDSKGARVELARDAPDIVHDTIVQILAGSPSHTNSNNMPFDKFFAICLCRTVESLRSKAKAKKRRFDQPNYLPIDHNTLPSIEQTLACQESPSQLEEMEIRQCGEAMRRTVRHTKLRGAAKLYAERMAEIAERDMDESEVAELLEVSPRSVDKLRQRVGEAVRAQVKKQSGGQG